MRGRPPAIQMPPTAFELRFQQYQMDKRLRRYATDALGPDQRDVQFGSNLRTSNLGSKLEAFLVTDFKEQCKEEGLL